MNCEGWSNEEFGDSEIVIPIKVEIHIIEWTYAHSCIRYKLDYGSLTYVRLESKNTVDKINFFCYNLLVKMVEIP
jgi:hypothetical protein